jgi:bleomycin hydrolase
MPRALDRETVEQLAKEFGASPGYRVVQNAVATTSVDEVALDRSVVVATDHSVSNLLDDWTATDQKKSGRCWLFAGANLLRVGAARALGVRDFEFSQNHLMFWDKLEKANHWRESIIATAGDDVDDRTVAHLLEHPAEDGGQWHMFVAVVRKHGLVPKVAMPETQSSSETARMNRALSTVLRQAARDLRAQAAAGASDDELGQAKSDALATVHRVLCIHLWTPPDRVFWQWTDKDRGFHREGWLTPQEFADRYATLPLDDYVCLVHDPRPGSESGRTYTVEHLGNVVGAPPVVYLNTEVELLKRLTMDTLLDGEPVWFGCDTGQMANTSMGVWDARLYDYDAVYDTETTLTKSDRLLHHASLMTHAMLFTGVDVVDGVSRRWRVENSWGDNRGDKGFWTMNDNWFAEHVFEVAVRRDRLPEELRGALHDEPVVLPAWDPMGALAH